MSDEPGVDEASNHGPYCEPLEAIAHRMRILCLETLIRSTAGHPGSSLSAIEILTALLFRVMQSKSGSLALGQDDRLVMSKGHADAAFYAALYLAGHLRKEQLWSMRHLGSPLQGHPDSRFLRLANYTSGSLGQGLSFAAGQATVGLRRGFRVFTLLGDGELQEGQVWEAVLYAAHNRLNNLVAVVDFNGYQLSCPSQLTGQAEAVGRAWESLGWNTCIVDGHDAGAVAAACQRESAQPRLVIARTVKGKGVSFMQGNNDYHGRPLTPAEAARAMTELGV